MYLPIFKVKLDNYGYNGHVGDLNTGLVRYSHPIVKQKSKILLNANMEGENLRIFKMTKNKSSRLVIIFFVNNFTVEQNLGRLSQRLDRSIAKT